MDKYRLNQLHSMKAKELEAIIGKQNSESVYAQNELKRRELARAIKQKWQAPNTDAERIEYCVRACAGVETAQLKYGILASLIERLDK